MEAIKNQIRRIIEKECKEALEKGLLNSASIVNQICKLLAEKEENIVVKPEPVYGCYENSDEFEVR
ncbi:MAG: hypothetical protein P8Z35_05980 [Ignavibacteriaceae bacterium]|jgi:hypothetical protein